MADEDDDRAMADDTSRGMRPPRAPPGTVPKPPAPSRMKESDVVREFPFQVRRLMRGGDEDRVNKFSKLMNEGTVRAFAVFGPLRCLNAAFSSFEYSRKETKYRGMFQQVFPCLAALAQLSGLRSRLLDATESQIPPLAGVIPLSDTASSESAAMFRIDVEHSTGHGIADYVLRTITKEKLDELKQKHPEFDWEQQDKEALATSVFDFVNADDIRDDASLDLKTDAVTNWKTKTRAQLISYGNQLAKKNIRNGFPPRPMYLLAVDAKEWRMCILDSIGVIDVKETGEVSGFDKFEKQQLLRAKWLSKKDLKAQSFFSDPNVKPWTEASLNSHLREVNGRLMKEEDPSGIVSKSYLVYNLWEDGCSHLWNGEGFKEKLLPGTLALCEGLLRLICGDKVCRAGWTAQKMRMLYAKEHEREVERCLRFERPEEQPEQQRGLNCAFSQEILRAACRELGALKPRMSEVAHHGLVESVDKVKGYWTSVAKQVKPDQLWKVCALYGGQEFLSSLEPPQPQIGTPIPHFIVNGERMEEDAVECFDALVISTTEMNLLPEIRWLNDCSVIVCNDMAVLCQLSCKLLQAEFNHLVVFAKHTDEQARSLLHYIQNDTRIVIVREESCLADIAAYLNVKVANGKEVKLEDIVGHAEKLTCCGNEAIVHSSSPGMTQTSKILEFQISGVSRSHFNERWRCLRTAVTAMTSAAKKGIIRGNGYAFYAASEHLQESDNDGLRVLKRSLEAVGNPLPEADSGCAGMEALLFKFRNPIQDDFDLLQSAEDTLDQVICMSRNKEGEGEEVAEDVADGKEEKQEEEAQEESIPSAGKRQHPGLLPSPKKSRLV